MQSAVHASLPDFRKWMRVKAQLAGDTNGLSWWNLFAPLSVSPGAISWDEGISLVKGAFASYSDQLSHLVDRSLSEQWIDAEPRSGKVGVIGTNATIDSKAYLDAFAAAPQLSITSKACPLFVEFVENGKTTGDEITKIAQDYLAQMKTAQIDTLVLGCTHYPLLTGVISYVMGNDVTLVSSAEETAKDLYRTLVETNLLNDQGAQVSHRFVATGDPDKFATLAKRFLGPEVVTVTNKI